VTSSDTPKGLAGIVVRGAGLAGAGFVIGQVLNLGFYLALARLATPKDFGQLAAGSVLVSLGLLFAESGMMAALIQRRDRVEEAASTALVATLLAGLGLGLLALAASPVVGIVFGSHTVALVAAASSGWVVLRSVAIVPDALMQKRFSFARRVIVDPLGFIAFGTTAVFATANGMGVWGLVLGNYAQYGGMALASWALAGWRPKLSLVSFAMWRELAGFGKHVVGAQLIGRISAGIGTAVIGRGVGTAGLGQYSYATRIATAPLGALVNAGSYVLYPAFAHIADQPARFRAALLRSLRLIALIGVPLSLIFLPLGESLAVIVFGPPWREAGYAAMALCGYTGARALVSVAREAFKAIGHPEVLPKVQIVSAVLTIGGMLALVPLGLPGVAAAVSASSVCVAVYTIRELHRVGGIPLRPMVDQIWPTLVAGAAMVAVLLPLEQLLVEADTHGTALGLALLVAEGALGAAIYLGALAAVAPAMARDLVGLVGLVRERFRQDRTGKALLEDEAEAEADVAASADTAVFPGP
jgi:O-antigen/teichoic acid export membrane protein